MRVLVLLIAVFTAQLFLIENVKSSTEPDDSSRGNNFVQDLTQPIDQILYFSENNQNSSAEYSKTLQRALAWSPIVYYSSNMSLNNFHREIIPVIQLLNQFNKNHQLILSLRYTNQSTFLYSRLKDVYYDLSINFDSEELTLIRSHLFAIVLDWQIDEMKYYRDSCDRNGIAFWRTSNNERSSYSYNANDDTHVVANYQFSNFMRNFLQFYSISFKNSIIPIGMAYNKKQISCQNFLLNQIEGTDFQVISFDSSFSWNLSPEHFEHSMKLALGENKKLLRSESCASISIYFNLAFYDYTKDLNIQNYVNYFLNIQNLTSAFFKDLYTIKYPRRFKKNVMLWVEKSKVGLIFGGFENVMGENETVTQFKAEDNFINKTCILPYLKANEGKLNICKFRKSLNEARDKHGTIVVDIDTWRAAARYISVLDVTGYDNQRCYEQTVTAHQSTQVLIDFPKDTWKVWPEIKESVGKLLRDYPNIAGMRMDTLIFSNEDLKRNTGMISGFMEEFEKLSSSVFNFRVGVSIPFERNFGTSVFREIGGGDDAKIRVAMNKIFDESVFDLAKIFVWIVNIKALESVPSRETHEAFLMRKIFLEAFPDKEVFIQFMYKYEEPQLIAELYDVPIILFPVEIN